MARGASTSRGAALRLSALLAAIALGACGDDTAAPAEPGEAPEGAAQVAAESQRDGDPVEGRALLLNAPYVSCGVPASLVDGKDVGPLLPLIGLPADVVTLEEREPQNRALPYFLTRATAPNGVELVATNCLACHAATFQGELVIGLGNANLDSSIDLSAAVALLEGQIDDPEEQAAFEEWRDRITTIAPHVAVDTVGVTAADNLAVELFGRRDPVSLEWRGDYVIDVPADLPAVPVATPPLWRMRKKHAMFQTGAFRGDHARFMFAASSMCLDDVEDALAIDAYFHHVRAFITSLSAPRYPGAIDELAAARGEQTFVRRCAHCHGTYGEGGSFPNLIIPIEEVGTDRALYDLGVQVAAIVGPWVAASFYGASNRIEETPGYYAPPLDGVWMTAPYLHNDSVPDLEALLDSSQRPRFFQRGRTDADFDWDRVGHRFTEVPSGKVSGDGSVENRSLYDTTRPGYGNQGHTYGDDLSADERADLLEYLKTL